MCVAEHSNPNGSKEDTSSEAKSSDYQRSFPLLKILWSESIEVRQLVDILRQEIADQRKLKRIRKGDYDNNLTVFIGNLVRAYTLKDLWVAYSRSPHRGYNEPHRYNPTGVSRNLIKIADSLIALGYLQQILGEERGKKKYRSRIKATPKLVQLWESEGITYEHFHDHPDTELIILKNFKSKKKDKSDPPPKFVDYTETEETSRLRSNLKQINDHFGKQNITLDMSEDAIEQMRIEMQEKKNEENKEEGKVNYRAVVDLTRCQIKRIFNNCDFSNGGRFYHGWWIEVPSDYRKHIVINGFKTIEIDYSAIHPRMLYALKKIPAPSEPYAIKGYGSEYRSAIKSALLVMINAKSQPSAIKAIQKKLLAETANTEFEKIENVKKLHDAIKATHAPISKYFNSNMGIKLQRIDSDIAEKVMLRLNGLPPIAALPVHDSFIVPEYAEELATGIMEEEFQKRLQQSIVVDTNIDAVTKAIRKNTTGSTIPIPRTLDIEGLDNDEWIWEVDSLDRAS